MIPAIGIYLFCAFLSPANSSPNNIDTMILEKNYSLEVIRYKIPAGQHQQFEQAYASAAQYLKASPYCKGYQVVHGTDEPDHYIVFIYWTSVADHLNGFRKSTDFMPFYTLVKPFFSNIEEMKHYEATDAAWKR